MAGGDEEGGCGERQPLKGAVGRANEVRGERRGWGLPCRTAGSYKAIVWLN